MKTSTVRAPISAFVVTFNEEEKIRACLESLEFCDEVLVIDSYSTDRTLEICEEMGAKVIQRDWPGYVKQKAFGLSECSHEWVINVDADEIVSKELSDGIISILEQAPDNGGQFLADGYEVNRVVHFLGRWWRRGGWYPEYRLRVFQKSKVTWGGRDPHEKAICSGKIDKLPGELYHYTYKDFEDQIQRLQKYAKIMAQQDFDAGVRSSILRLTVNPMLRFIKFYLIKGGFREGVAGFIVACLESYYTFIKYVFLWELGFNEKKNSK